MLFAQKAAEIENLGQPNRLSEHRSYVLGAVLSAATQLEATINELFVDASDRYLMHLGTIGKQQVELLGWMWERVLSRRVSFSILEKYDAALELAGRKPLMHDRAPYQDVKALIDLRNELIHFAPQSVPDDCTAARLPQSERPKLEQRLRGRFAENSLVASGNPYKFDKLLGSGCARWSVESTITFVDAFCAQMGIAPPYESFRDDLRVEMGAE